MKLRKLFAGVAAVATLLSGFALGAVSANAATGDVTITPATIAINADDAARLKDRTFAYVKLADYNLYEAEGTTSTLSLTTTSDATVQAAIVAAAKAANNGVAPDGDPMAWVSNNLKDSAAAPYAGRLRDFVNGLSSLKDSATAFTAAQTATSDEGRRVTYTLADPGLYLLFDTTGASKDGDNTVTASLPILVGTKVTVKDGATVQVPTQYIDGEVDVKNEITTVTKTVDTTAASIGQKKTYTVTAKVPNWIGKDLSDPSTAFTFTDTPSKGQTVDFASIKVQVDGKDIDPAFALTKPAGVTDDTWRADGTSAFTVDVTEYAKKAAVDGKLIGKVITLTYDVTINSDILELTDGVSNKVEVDNAGSSSQASSEKIRTAGFSFTKVGGDGTTPLAGAQFQVKSGETVLKFTKGADGTYVLAEDQNAAADNTNGPYDTLVTPADGVVNVKGLGEGTYTVIETRAPDGYWNTALPSFTVKVDKAGAVTYEKADDFFGLVTFTEGKTPVVKNVTNVTELPKTGAAGIALFVVIAALLAGAAATVYGKSRKTRAALRA
ncbi:SpaA isopeptide-forming pilin-related protein [Bifidobacterium leontopitheci]|uniref:Isopeptide-forming domain-containing fimbrial protein n=1 Tax=Bifidobacterium leontopitheci TaxID=2650774 RepID=A0A6I1GP36_9BIFI|nr:SpaA isopeptide-forming pilin-related protein [Bifidobacterium leontopitheci]KAB7789828.1 hypothetical protein F7D09_1671 [Bifidobacterium leontopitheci]